MHVHVCGYIAYSLHTVRIHWSQLSVWCYVVGYLAQAALGLVSSGTKTFKHWSKYYIHTPGPQCKTQIE